MIGTSYLPSMGLAEVKVMAVCELPAALPPILEKASQTFDLFNDTIARSSWFDPQKECFIVVMLNRKCRVTAFNLVSLGTQSSALVHPREAFRAAVVHAASAIVCIHNHPSGDPLPSSADVQVTRQLREAGRALDIELMDHVIVGRVLEDPRGKGYYSFRDEGFL